MATYTHSNPAYDGQQGYPPGNYPPGQQYPPGNYPPGQQPGAYPPGMVGAQPGPGRARQVQWMNRPAGVPGCPPGLEYLTQINQLLVHQQIEMMELVLNWESKNRYQIKNTMGQQVYFASEESDTCGRQCCGPNRAFTMHITDNMGQEVIRVSREFRCCSRYNCNCCICGDCCAHEITVEAPPGQVIGYIKQVCSCWIPRFFVLDATRQPVLVIDGPCCICNGACCVQDQDFMVRPVDGGDTIGKLTKQYSGFFNEFFTTSDNFNVSFPMDLDVKVKATMLAGIFLIDFMFFEDKGDRGELY